MADSDKLFRCKVIAPSGTRMDCDVLNVEVPAHDGQLGVLAGHMPIFCQLALGLMKVAQVDPDMPGRTLDHELIIDGGFVMVASNSLTVIAYEVFTLEDLQGEGLEDLQTQLKHSLERAQTPEERLHDHKKIELVERLALADSTHK
jgi:F-type H+-transporting ATPase subunit epsilon